MEIRLARETALLREMLRPEHNGKRIAELIGPADSFEWDLFEEILFRSRLVPLVSATVAGLGEEAVFLPEKLRVRLRLEEERAAVRSLLKSHELGQIADHLRGSGVRAMVLKGIPFAQRFFGDPALRDIRDLDLLIAPEQLRPAERVLRNLGYSLFEVVHSRDFYRRHHFHVVYVRKSKSIDVVELHWNLLRHPYGLHLNTTDLFQNSRLYELDGRSIEILPVLDELVYTVASLRSAHFRSLRRLVDLDRAMRSVAPCVRALDVVRRAASWGMEEEAIAAFHFLLRFWGDEAYRLDTPRRIRRFASRYRGSDFFGISSGREMRLRIWCAAFFGKWGGLEFGRQVVFPDEEAGAELYYHRERSRTRSMKVRQTLTGVVSLLDLSANLAAAPFRRMG